MEPFSADFGPFPRLTECQEGLRDQHSNAHDFKHRSDPRGHVSKNGEQVEVEGQEAEDEVYGAGGWTWIRSKHRAVQPAHQLLRLGDLREAAEAGHRSEHLEALLKLLGNDILPATVWTLDVYLRGM